MSLKKHVVASGRKSASRAGRRPAAAVRRPAAVTRRGPAPRTVTTPSRRAARKASTGSQTRGNKETPRSKGPSANLELEHFRQLLLAKRREILGDVGAMESEAFKNQDSQSVSPMHMADVGTDNFEQEFTLGLVESERQLLREIQEALDRIDEGTYGICLATGKPIGKARLNATPWAKYCIEYARQLESNPGFAPPRHPSPERAAPPADED